MPRKLTKQENVTFRGQTHIAFNIKIRSLHNSGIGLIALEFAKNAAYKQYSKLLDFIDDNTEGFLCSTSVTK